jgi:hypothetical protein
VARLERFFSLSLSALFSTPAAAAAVFKHTFCKMHNQSQATHTSNRSSAYRSNSWLPVMPGIRPTTREAQMKARMLDADAPSSFLSSIKPSSL